MRVQRVKTSVLARFFFVSKGKINVDPVTQVCIIRVMENTDENQIQYYNLTKWALSLLQEKLAKINKRAAKKNFGCPELRLVDHETFYRVAPRDREAVDLGLKDYEEAVKIEYHKVSIEGDAPKFAGWDFLGTLDHVSIANHVMVNTVPGKTIPEQYFHAEPVCDHCGKVRYRKDTFVLQHENGEYKQVGRLCIRDFLGHDVAGLARYLQYVRELMGALDDEDSEYYGRGSAEAYSYDLKRTLEITVAVIRAFGWTSRAAARSDNTGATRATAADVMTILDPPRKGGRWLEAFKKTYLENRRPEEDAEEVRKVLEWVAEQEATNEYMHNVKAIANAEYVNYKTIGFAASMVAAYQRAMEKLRQRELQRRNSKNEWIGEEKQKIELTVDVIGVRYIENAYTGGSVALHRMRDPEGRVVTWFAYGSKDNNLEAGKKYKIKATVKKHDTYKDWKQTLVNRVKVLEELSD